MNTHPVRPRSILQMRFINLVDDEIGRQQTVFSTENRFDEFLQNFHLRNDRAAQYRRKRLSFRKATLECGNQKRVRFSFSFSLSISSNVRTYFHYFPDAFVIHRMDPLQNELERKKPKFFSFENQFIAIQNAFAHHSAN